MRESELKQEGTIASRYALDYLRLAFRDKAKPDIRKKHSAKR